MDRFEELFEGKFKDFGRPTDEKMKKKLLLALPSSSGITAKGISAVVASVAIIGSIVLIGYLKTSNDVNEAVELGVEKQIIVEPKSSDEEPIDEIDQGISTSFVANSSMKKNEVPSSNSFVHEAVSYPKTKNKQASAVVSFYKRREVKPGDGLTQLAVVEPIKMQRAKELSEPKEKNTLVEKPEIGSEETIDYADIESENQTDTQVGSSAERENQKRAGKNGQRIDSDRDRETKQRDLEKRDELDLLEIVPQKKPLPIFMTLQLDAFLGYNNIDLNEDDNFLVSEVENEPLVSLNRVGFRLQGGVGLQLNRKWSTYLNLTAQMAQYNVKYDVLNSSFDSTVYVNDGDQGYIQIFRDSEDQEIDVNQVSIGATAGVNYIYLRKTKLKNSLDMSFSYLSNMNASEGYLRKDQLYFTIGHKINYAVGRRLELLLVPSLSYSLLQNQSDYQLFLKPYSLGIGAGILFKLGQSK